MKFTVKHIIRGYTTDYYEVEAETPEEAEQWLEKNVLDLWPLRTEDRVETDGWFEVQT